jgi:hypothetical protein
MAADTIPSLPDLHAQMLDRVVAAVRSDDRFEALPSPTLPSTGHRSIVEALKRSAALHVELRTAEPPSTPVKGVPGLLLDFIDGKQSRA